RSPPRYVSLDGGNQCVDVFGEDRGIAPEGLWRWRLVFEPPLPECGPIALDRPEFPADVVVPWHEQRTLGIAIAQQPHAAFEFPNLGGECTFVPRADGKRDPIHL